MSMYDLVIADGNEEQRGQLLGLTILDIRREDFGRFRDAWLEIDQNGILRIAVYTRNGGGNRPDYEEVTEALRKHPRYIDDADDDFDNTYATYYFHYPETMPEHLLELEGYDTLDWSEIVADARAVAYGKPRDMSAVWQEAIAKLQTDGPTEEQVAAFSAGDGGLNIVVTGRDPSKLFDEEA